MDEKLREEMYKAMRAGTPRAARARRFADHVLHMMQDFVPRDRDCERAIHDYLTEIGWSNNFEIISVPPEYDGLTKLQLEGMRLETHPIFVPTDS